MFSLMCNRWTKYYLNSYQIAEMPFNITRYPGTMPLIDRLLDREIDTSG